MMPKPAFRLIEPDPITTPVIVASPHSGRYYPWSFMRRTVLDERSIRSSEDAYMDELVADAPSFGAPLVCAEYPRAFLDLNRGADELDPAVVEGIRHPTQNPRISSGLGVVPRVVANGRMIYRGKLPRGEAEARIDTIWTPYHDCLKGLIARAQARFGEAILLDFHSMPHEALDAVTRPRGRRPDVVLGDRFGSACRPEIIEELEVAFVSAGLVVSRNAPFAGAYVAQTYGRPSHGSHVVQIEIDRALYMNERLIQRSEGFDDLRRTISNVLAHVIGPARRSVPLAAE